MTVLHTGATKDYVAGWEHVFGKNPKPAKQAAGKAAQKPPGKKAAGKKAAGKRKR